MQIGGVRTGCKKNAHWMLIQECALDANWSAHWMTLPQRQTLHLLVEKLLDAEVAAF